jgi:hypothetical protein
VLADVGLTSLVAVDGPRSVSILGADDPLVVSAYSYAPRATSVVPSTNVVISKNSTVMLVGWSPQDR